MELDIQTYMAGEYEDMEEGWRMIRDKSQESVIRVHMEIKRVNHAESSSEEWSLMLNSNVGCSLKVCYHRLVLPVVVTTSVAIETCIPGL